MIEDAASQVSTQGYTATMQTQAKGVAGGGGRVGGAGKAKGASGGGSGSGSASEVQSTDPADTNGDGKVSVQELLAYLEKLKTEKNQYTQTGEATASAPEPGSVMDVKA